MVRVLGATLIAVLLCGAAAAPPAKSTAPPSKSNEAQIRERLDEFAATWNKHDPTDMAYFWSVDGDLITPLGRKAKGLLEIQRLFADEHSKALKNSTYTNTSSSVRFLEPELALVDSDAEISGVTAPDGTVTTMKPHVTTLWRKSGGKWWIAATRAFVYVPPPPPPPPAPAPVPK
jgi:uncharacterized protein (TIGR02246 family)